MRSELSLMGCRFAVSLPPELLNSSADERYEISATINDQSLRSIRSDPHFDNFFLLQIWRNFSDSGAYEISFPMHIISALA